MTQMRAIHKLSAYFLLLIGAVVFVTPFLFMILTSLKPMHQISTIPFTWWPDPIRFQNYREAFTVQPMGRFFLNSVIISSLAMLGMVFSCTLGGWGFSRPYFWGRDFLFLLLLSVMMIPGQVTMIPMYLLFSRLGWINTILPLVVPTFFAAQPFYVFMVRQFFMSLPSELNEAAIIDGCSHYRVFWSIGLPLVKPAVVTVAVFTFVFSWSDFFTPLLYLSSREKFTVALGLTAFQEEGFTHWDHLMPASTVAILPVLAVFLFFQRYFVKGLASTGLKE